MIEPVLVTAAFAVVGLLIRSRTFSRVARYYRGVRVVHCPERGLSAAIQVDRRVAAVSAALGQPRLRIRTCTCWPERHGCTRACLAQVRAAPESGIPRVLVERWAKGRDCALCGEQLGGRRGPSAALLGPDGSTVEWQDLAPEGLPGALRQARPVCWYCHVTATLYREQPHLLPARAAGPRDGRHQDHVARKAHVVASSRKPCGGCP